jgi:hypothetical protein
MAAEQQIPHEVMKPTWDGAKASLVWVLPALWVLISAQGLSAQCSDCAIEPSQHSASSLQSGKRHAPDAIPSRDLSLRRPSNRIVKSGKNTLYDVAPFLRQGAVERATFTIYLPQCHPSPALATRWQFDCRAAREPRAPSAVS